MRKICSDNRDHLCTGISYCRIIGVDCVWRCRHYLVWHIWIGNPRSCLNCTIVRIDSLQPGHADRPCTSTLYVSTGRLEGVPLSAEIVNDQYGLASPKRRTNILPTVLVLNR